MPSDDAAEGGTALVASMMEPIALTKSSPDAAVAGRTAVGLRLLKPNAQELARRIRPAPPAPFAAQRSTQTANLGASAAYATFLGWRERVSSTINPSSNVGSSSRETANCIVSDERWACYFSCWPTSEVRLCPLPRRCREHSRHQVQRD